jgi:hypothetical protein
MADAPVTCLGPNPCFQDRLSNNMFFFFRENTLFSFHFFHIHTVHLDIIKVFYSPADAQVNCLKNNFKIYIKIDVKTAPTCFGVITIIVEHIIRAS